MKKILVTFDMFREGFTELENKYEVTFPNGRDFSYWRTRRRLSGLGVAKLRYGLMSSPPRRT